MAGRWKWSFENAAKGHFDRRPSVRQGKTKIAICKIVNRVFEFWEKRNPRNSNQFIWLCLAKVFWLPPFKRLYYEKLGTTAAVLRVITRNADSAFGNAVCLRTTDVFWERRMERRGKSKMLFTFAAQKCGTLFREPFVRQTLPAVMDVSVAIFYWAWVYYGTGAY